MAAVRSSGRHLRSRTQTKRSAPAIAEGLETRLILSASVLSYRDGSQQGVNSAEVALTPANVKVGTFGKLYTTAVDGQVYAEPLVEPGVTIAAGVNTTAGAAGVHDVVFVATENDSLYAIDTSTGAILWKRTFLNTSNAGGDTNNTSGATSITTVSSSDVGVQDVNPKIGITSTPVIDASTGILYVNVKTKEVIGGVTYFVQRLHAINVSDGTDAAAPYVIGLTTGGNTNTTSIYVYGNGDGHVTDPYNGTGQQVVQFNALREFNRVALSLVNNTLYVGFASHGDNGPYHGWVLTWNVSNIKTSGFTLNGVLCTSPNNGEAGIWQAGGAIAFEPDDSAFYFMTGNGTGGPPSLGSNGLPTDANYNEAVVKAVVDPSTTATSQGPNGWGLKVVDFFIPYNVSAMDNADSDFGSGAPILLPASAGIPGHPNLLVAGGKDGRLFVLDRDDLGGYNSQNDNALNAVPQSSGHSTAPTIMSGTLSTPAYFNGKLYIVSGYTDWARSFTISSTGTLVTTSQTAVGSFGSLPGSPIVSADGTTNGIVWQMDRNSNVLRAYDANTFSTELWDSGQAAGSADSLGASVKFNPPTVVNGEVFVGTASTLVVYGLTPGPGAVPHAPVLTSTTLSGSSINLTWTDSTAAPNTASAYLIEQSTNGTTFTQVATAPAGSTSIAVGGLAPLTKYYFRIRGLNSVGDSAYSNIVNSTTTNESALIDFASGFAGAQSQLTLNGSAAISTSSLQLTNNMTNEASSAFDDSLVDVTGFTSQFTFQLSSGANAADGFTFTLQNTGPTALGPGGGGLGYGPVSIGGTGGIANSIAIKFDLLDNNGEGVDSTGLFENGASPTDPGAVDLTPSGLDLHLGDVFQVNLAYDGTNLTETLLDTNSGKSVVQSYPVDIPTVIGSNSAYAGFTAGTSAKTATQNILTWTYAPSAATSPNAPLGLGAAAATATSVNLNWTNEATNQTGYHLDRATDPGFTQNLITETLPANPASFTDTADGIAPGSTFYYQIRAFNSAGDSGNSNVASISIPDPPPKPTNQMVTGVTATEIDMGWQDNAGHNATGYTILAAVNHGSFSVVANLPPTSRPAPSAYSYDATGLTPGTFYEFHIVAINSSGNVDFAGVNATTLTTPPTEISAGIGAGVINLSWTAPTGAVSYNIYRGTTPGGEGDTPIASEVESTVYQDTSVTAGVSYYYEITALNNNISNAPPIPSESARSAEVSPTNPTISIASSPLGVVGQHVDISVTGNDANFAAGVTTASLGAGVTIDSVEVDDANHAIVHADIASGATVGFRDLVVTTGGSSITVPNGFLVDSSADMPVMIAPTAQTVFAGQDQLFNLGYFGGGAGPWTIDINWGDGTSNTTFNTSSAGNIEPQDHTYATSGSQAPTITITNLAAASQNVGSATAAINVIDDLALLLTSSKGAGLTVSGRGKISASGTGQIKVNSTNKAAVSVAKAASASAYQISVVGHVKKGSPLTGTAITGQSPASDPLASLPVPAIPDQKFKAIHYSIPLPLTLQPGEYTGGIHISGRTSVTLNPGLYFIPSGGLSVGARASLTGTGVTIFIAKGATQLGGLINLTPATSGAYKGIVFFQAPSDKSAINITGNVTTTGVFYAPSAALNLSGRGVLEDDNDNDADDASDFINALSIFSKVQIGSSASLTIDSADNTAAGLIA